MMTRASHKTFVEARPFADPEAAARELFRIYRMKLADGASHPYTGVTNSQFTSVSGGSVAEYALGRDFGIAQKWFRIDESGTRVFLLPDGEDA